MSEEPLLNTATPSGSNVEPPGRSAFVLSQIDGEPDGDRMLTLQSGIRIRERILRTGESAEGIAGLSTGRASPAAFSLLISNALLDDQGQVVRDDQGRPVVARAHEFALSREALGRLGTQQAVESAVLEAREVAAFIAEKEFEGFLLSQTLLSGR